MLFCLVSRLNWGYGRQRQDGITASKVVDSDDVFITVNDLLDMPVADRLRLVEDLWDSIAEVPEKVELSDAQRKELDKRLEKYHRDPEAGSPWEDVKKSILKHG